MVLRALAGEAQHEAGVGLASRHDRPRPQRLHPAAGVRADHLRPTQVKFAHANLLCLHANGRGVTDLGWPSHRRPVRELVAPRMQRVPV